MLLKNFILKGGVTLLLSFCAYFAVGIVDTFSVDNFHVAKVEAQRNDENKILLSVSVDQEQFMIPIYVQNVEKDFFQFESGKKILFKTVYTFDNKPEYVYIGNYFLPYLAFLLTFFITVLYFLFGKIVFRPLLTLLVSLAFTLFIFFPSLLHTENVMLWGAGFLTLLLILSILFTHNFSREAVIAAVGSALSLIAIYFLGQGMVSFFQLFGYGASNISYLGADYPNLDMQGIFLLGIYLGVIGMIDDVTVNQAVAADEIHKANSQYTVLDLYTAGMNIGKSHIFSMINTLVFAYIGTSIPLYLYVMSLDYPVWVILNTPIFVEEFVRAFIGIITLLASIPLTAFISAWWIKHR